MHEYTKAVKTAVGKGLPYRLFNHYHPCQSIHKQLLLALNPLPVLVYDHICTGTLLVEDSSTSPPSQCTQSNGLRTVGESSCETHINTEGIRTLHLEQATSNNEMAYRCTLTLTRKKRASASPFQ